MGLRWAKWWLPGAPTMDTFGNASSLDAEQHYAPSDLLEEANRRGDAACAREAFCLQAALKRAVVRAASRHAPHGATRRAEHAANLLLAESLGGDGIAAMSLTRLEEAARALGCTAVRWEGQGWCSLN